MEPPGRRAFRLPTWLVVGLSPRQPATLRNGRAKPARRLSARRPDYRELKARAPPYQARSKTPESSCIWSPPRWPRGASGRPPTPAPGSSLKTEASAAPTRPTRSADSDDDGPIFPTGDIDPRLDAHHPVIGVITPDGTAVAFPTAAAKTALANGRTVATAGVEVYTDGAGLRTRTPDGSDLASHQAFWFAWSQFHPDTIRW